MQQLLNGGNLGVTSRCRETGKQIDQGVCLDRYVEANSMPSGHPECIGCEAGQALRRRFCKPRRKDAASVVLDHRHGADPRDLVGVQGDPVDQRKPSRRAR